jgi:hypothetical protein
MVQVTEICKWLAGKVGCDTYVKTAIAEETGLLTVNKKNFCQLNWYDSCSISKNEEIYSSETSMKIL